MTVYYLAGYLNLKLLCRFRHNMHLRVKDGFSFVNHCMIAKRCKVFSPPISTRTPTRPGRYYSFKDQPKMTAFVLTCFVCECEIEAPNDAVASQQAMYMSSYCIVALSTHVISIVTTTLCTCFPSHKVLPLAGTYIKKNVKLAIEVHKNNFLINNLCVLKV